MLCRELRARGNLPIIILTAMAEGTDRIVDLELGADDPVTRPFAPREVLARATSMDEPTAAVDLGADVVVEPPQGERIVVRCRPLALKRALRSLVENAVRYGGGVRLALAREQGRITLTIDDDRPGLPSDLLERVFDPFIHGEASRSPETGGSGLGLAIARAILRSHGGDVSLANRTGGGLRATIHPPGHLPGHLPGHDN